MMLVAPKQILPRVVDHVVINLKKTEFLQVTVEEYNIMLAPEGHLYDTTALKKLVW